MLTTSENASTSPLPKDPASRQDSAPTQDIGSSRPEKFLELKETSTHTEACAVAPSRLPWTPLCSPRILAAPRPGGHLFFFLSVQHVCLWTRSAFPIWRWKPSSTRSGIMSDSLATQAIETASSIARACISADTLHLSRLGPTQQICAHHHWTTGEQASPYDYLPYLSFPHFSLFSASGGCLAISS